jgi:hypothetical protein
MTIIAYRDGILAADGLTETDGLIVPGPPKIVRRGDAWVASSGALGDCAAFERWVADGRPDDEAPELDDGFEALVAERGGRVRWYDKRCAPVDVTALPWAALGSGHQVAAVVLAQGGSAVEACRLACRLRTDCGPPVVFVDLARGGKELQVAPGEEGA